MGHVKFSQVFNPVFVAAGGRRRARRSRRLTAALMAFLTALLLSAMAAAQPGQLAELRMPGLETPSKSFDLRALEAKIRSTDALDMFAKMNLKFEISSLIEDVGRAQARSDAARLAEVRVRFDKVIANTVRMLREGDVPLADEVAGSREALWQFLNDPETRLAFADPGDDGQTE